MAELTAWWWERGGSDLWPRVQWPLSLPSLSHAPRNFDEVISCFANMPRDIPLFSKAHASLYSEDDSTVSVRVGSRLRRGRGGAPGPSTTHPVLLSQSLREEPIHILNVAIQCADHLEDEELVPIFRTFAQSKVCWACLCAWVPAGGGGAVSVRRPMRPSPARCFRARDLAPAESSPSLGPETVGSGGWTWQVLASSPVTPGWHVSLRGCCNDEVTKTSP